MEAESPVKKAVNAGSMQTYDNDYQIKNKDARLRRDFQHLYFGAGYSKKQGTSA